MKRLLFAILLFAPAAAFAEKRFMIMASSNSAPLPQIKEFVSEAFYYSSATCAQSSLSNVVFSTTPGYAYVLSVSSKGAGSPTIEVFDASGSTTTARRIKTPVNAMTERDHLMNVYFSSGLSVSNQGNPPACMEIFYSER